MLGWRPVPTDASTIGALARGAMPAFEQLFLTSTRRGADGDRPAGIVLDRQAMRLRKRVEREHRAYFASLSSRTLVYKGMVTTLQLEPFYPDLSDERFVSTLALVHSRYSTNTFPSWPLAQPFRMIAHNGEINTVQGNRNWMRARQSQLASEVLGDLTPLLPIVTEGASDSASFDEVVELLTLAGRSLPHAIMMMVPEAWENQPDLDPELRSLLRVPLGDHGAVGRPRGHRLHRRHPRRRDPRPQRAAPRPLGRHDRRARRARVRDRRARPAARAGAGARDASAPGRCSSSTPPPAG